MQVLIKCFVIQAAHNLEAATPATGIGSWINPNSSLTLSDTGIVDPFVDGMTLGTYEFYWQIQNGVCPVLVDTVTVKDAALPVVTAPGDEYIFPPSSVTLTASSDAATQFEWFPKTYIAGDTSSTAVVSPLETTTYYVIGTTSDNCSSVDSVTVGVNVELEIPTAFTPDGDNYNDVWNIKELSNYPGCVVTIYNRWGNKMFESEGYATPWDGTFNGEQLPSGAYYFVIDLGVGDITPLTGSITIIQ